MKKKLLNAIIIYLMINFHFCFGSNVIKIDTIVNEEIITNYDISQRTILIELLQNNKPNIDDVRSELIKEELIKQYSKKNNFIVDEEEYKKFENATIKSFGINKEELLKIFKSKNFNYNNFEKFLKLKILWQKIIKNKFVKKSKLTNNDINKPIYKNSEYKKINLSEIVIPFKERGKENSIKLANRLYKEIKYSNNFDLAVKRFSKSDTSKNGGLIGSLDLKNLPLEVQISLENLAVNEITKPIIMQDKVIILRVNNYYNIKENKEKDYEVKYLISKVLPNDILKKCDSNINLEIKTSKISKVKNEYVKILKQLNNYQTKKISSDPPKYLILCDRKILLNSSRLNEFKNEIFNDKIKVQSDKFLNELFRSASIKQNE